MGNFHFSVKKVVRIYLDGKIYTSSKINYNLNFNLNLNFNFNLNLNFNLNFKTSSKEKSVSHLFNPLNQRSYPPSNAVLAKLNFNLNLNYNFKTSSKEKSVSHLFNLLNQRSYPPSNAILENLNFKTSSITPQMYHSKSIHKPPSTFSFSTTTRQQAINYPFSSIYRVNHLINFQIRPCINRLTMFIRFSNHFLK